METLLDDDLAWRRAELVALARELERHERSAPDAPLTRALARGAVALLYAHWEGYAKEACEGYLNYVAVRKLRYEELSDGFLVTALKSLMRRLDAGDEAATLDTLDLVRRPGVARARVPKKAVINTRSNLRHDVLIEMFTAIGLPIDDFVTRKHFIDRSLCDARNEIAHGRLYFPESSTFEKSCDDVLDMLTRLRTTIIDHARDALYRYSATQKDVAEVQSA
ncbi:hypothetical protein SAMN04489727_8346 [Amycolatopsis tolypomycina]|uniref:MAE-28990/MAE-18760-like HEPN domain-containing protein n=1 Tax=Amycolatopsis tolypomycina TaxID=208445 RepID=A0A1H5BMA4_9PSEU|nr:MAE_28990/MAE_18760 family HEPN-like nuclease [Amycolatopsis tolypomycina]SED55408.1 hypothetical protein SAMN04489727_8346 [Amycolatopsis tolypomycina]